MKNNVIKKNKTVNSYCSVGLLTGAILVVLLTVFGEFKNEARGILICACHGIFSKNALAKLYRCGILDIAISDSIPQEEDVVSIVSLSPIIAKYINENF